MLPCRIEHDGPARVATYFKVTDGAGEGKEAAFRGRRLLGQSAALPEGAQGLILEQAWGEHDDQILLARGRFTEVTHWQHDARPGPDALYAKWMEWLALSRAVHE
jgi:hypothetical protein